MQIAVPVELFLSPCAAPSGGAGEGLNIQSVAFLNGGLLPELHHPLLTQKLLSNAYIGG